MPRHSGKSNVQTSGVLQASCSLKFSRVLFSVELMFVHLLLTLLSTVCAL